MAGAPLGGMVTLKNTHTHTHVHTHIHTHMRTRTAKPLKHQNHRLRCSYERCIILIFHYAHSLLLSKQFWCVCLNDAEIAANIHETDLS